MAFVNLNEIAELRNENIRKYQEAYNQVKQTIIELKTRVKSSTQLLYNRDTIASIEKMLEALNSPSKDKSEVYRLYDELTNLGAVPEVNSDLLKSISEFKNNDLDLFMFEQLVKNLQNFYRNLKERYEKETEKYNAKIIRCDEILADITLLTKEELNDLELPEDVKENFLIYTIYAVANQEVKEDLHEPVGEETETIEQLNEEPAEVVDSQESHDVLEDAKKVLAEIDAIKLRYRYIVDDDKEEIDKIRKKLKTQDHRKFDSTIKALKGKLDDLDRAYDTLREEVEKEEINFQQVKSDMQNANQFREQKKLDKQINKQIEKLNELFDGIKEQNIEEKSVDTNDEEEDPVLKKYYDEVEMAEDFLHLFEDNPESPANYHAIKELYGKIGKGEATENDYINLSAMISPYKEYFSELDDEYDDIGDRNLIIFLNDSESGITILEKDLSSFSRGDLTKVKRDLLESFKALTTVSFAEFNKKHKRAKNIKDAYDEKWERIRNKDARYALYRFVNISDENKATIQQVLGHQIDSIYIVGGVMQKRENFSDNQLQPLRTNIRKNEREIDRLKDMFENKKITIEDVTEMLESTSRIVNSLKKAEARH